jgi:hypothetical protein
MAAKAFRIAPCQVFYLDDGHPRGPLFVWRPDMQVPPGWLQGPAEKIPCGRLGRQFPSGDCLCRDHYEELLRCATCRQEKPRPGLCPRCG